MSRLKNLRENFDVLVSDVEIESSNYKGLESELELLMSDMDRDIEDFDCVKVGNLIKGLDRISRLFDDGLASDCYGMCQVINDIICDEYKGYFLSLNSDCVGKPWFMGKDKEGNFEIMEVLEGKLVLV